ncbi:type III-B CRISPR-associated protein Cas10/Cmr2 [Synergistales bacterium]|nr:type III-B CRISPR-associated protein Cas10/Cmr2 [Synergistales bacterium]
MSRCLLQISIGPVQDFIAAARRTRDLWFGSFMLSEISKAAAKAVDDAGGHLIFPNFDGLEKDEINDKAFNVANVILAKVDGEERAREVSHLAKAAAEEQWLVFVDEARNKLRGHVDESAWDYQKTGVIEFYSAWHPFDDDSYGASRQAAARLLAARKNLRDFAPWDGKHGVLKSSLDGMRESVLIDNSASKNIKGVRIKAGEALDLVGCVKRAAGGDAPFPSVVRIALDPWIRGIKEEKAKSYLADLKGCCEELKKQGVLSNVQGAEFPYEGPALLPHRYAEFQEGAENPDAVKAITDKMGAIMANLYKTNRVTEPYLAVLSADGDRVGQAISSLTCLEDHQKFSRQLSKFAGQAREIIKKYCGSCVYTGGDDVLAFLPVDNVLKCARELYEKFREPWKDGANLKTVPTLSVGIAIAHASEDLESLLSFGRDAEKLAKHGDSEGDADIDRKGLAITVRARGNSEFHVREQWKDVSSAEKQLSQMSLDKRVIFWARRFAERRIPSKFPYELRGAAKFYDRWETEGNLDEAMRFDVKRIFGRKDLQLLGVERERVMEYIEDVVKGSYKSIEKLSDELLAAQWIGAAYIAAAGKWSND